MYMSSAHDTHADFLKENSCAQSQCSDWKFCAETCIKNYIKHVKLKKKTLSNGDNYMKLLPVFSCFLFISPQFAQFLKYFAPLCDCMIAAFWNAALMTLSMTGQTLWPISSQCPPTCSMRPLQMLPYCICLLRPVLPHAMFHSPIRPEFLIVQLPPGERCTLYSTVHTVMYTLDCTVHCTLYIVDCTLHCTL